MKTNSDILAYRDKLIKSDLSQRKQNYEQFKENIQKRQKDSSNMSRIINEVRGK